MNGFCDWQVRLSNGQGVQLDQGSISKDEERLREIFSENSGFILGFFSEVIKITACSNKLACFST